jgi:hypothetical protein
MHRKNAKIVDKLFNSDKELPVTVRTYDTVPGQCGGGGMTFIHISLRNDNVEARQEKSLNFFYISCISAGKMPTSNRLEGHACTV